MRRPIQRLRALGLAFAVLASGFIAVPGPVHADGVSDQQQQVKDDLAEIERLEQKSAQLNEEYLGYLNEKAELEAEIAVGQQQIDAQQTQLNALQTQLASVAVQQFTGGDGGGFAMFGDTSSATDSLQRDQLVRTAVNAGAASTDDYNSMLDQLSAENEDLQAKQAKVAKLADQAADTLERTKQAGIDYQAELDRDQATLGDLLAQEQARQVAEAAAQHAAQVAQAKADEKAAADRAAKQAADDQAARDQAAQNQAGPDQPTPTTTGSSSGSSSGNDGNTTSSSAKVDASSGAGSDNAAAGDASFGATADVTVDTVAEITAATSAETSASSADTSSSNVVETAPPVSSRAEVAVDAARSQLGVPYQFAMSSPGVAFDCSGLTAYAWAKAGVSIPHQSAMQYASTPHVAIADIQPGDLLFFYSPISHVSIYIGNGMEIHAPAPGKFVEIASVNWAKVVGASRPG